MPESAPVAGRQQHAPDISFARQDARFADQTGQHVFMADAVLQREHGIERLRAVQRDRQDSAVGFVPAVLKVGGCHDYWDASTSVAFHPQGQQVLTGSCDDTARLLDVPGATGAGALGAAARQRLFVHGKYAPSSALFDAEGNLLDWNDEAIDTWLFSLSSGTPEPIETVIR